MSEIATYTFVPWVRQGIANQIQGSSGQRATIPIELVPSGTTPDGGTQARPAIPKNIEIYGPGDVVGLDPRTIIRVEPQNWISNFEPNYLPAIEFYDEDLPWRYSPISPAGHRLIPWIMLVVLEDSELEEGRNVKDRPLPYFLPQTGARFPAPDQLWAWAHVHLNESIIGSAFLSEDEDAIESGLATLLADDPDLGYSRIVCPRRLKADTSYHAFLVPTFETGRLAGLGQDPSGAGVHDTAWSDAATPPTEVPYYHRWYFRTGAVGDFEYLVRLLKPQPIDSRVGVRDMDVQEPGANIRGIVDALAAPPAQRLDGILKLGGALRIPDVFYTPAEFLQVLKYRNWATLAQPYPHPFQADLASFINLTDSYEVESAEDANAGAGIHEVATADDPESEYDIGQNPDPLITAPLYGRWHALTRRLLETRDGTPMSPDDNWVHELNLDPRWRVAAGFGTTVVQENQEDYMQAAWEQVGDVLEANKAIRFGQLAKEVTFAWYDGHMRPTRERVPAEWLMLTSPVHARILHDTVAMHETTTAATRPDVPRRVTVRHGVRTSRTPRAVLSPMMRKQLRPRGKLVRRLALDPRTAADDLVVRVNSGEISAAPPRVTPRGLDALDEASEALMPRGYPAFLIDLLKRFPWIQWLPFLLALVLFVILLMLGAGPAVYAMGALAIAAAVYLRGVLRRGAARIAAAESVRPRNQTPESVDSWPTSPDFRLVAPGEPFRPSIGVRDSEEAIRFKAALKDTYALVQDSVRASVIAPKPSLDLGSVGAAVFDALDPDVTVPRWVFGGVHIPARIKIQLAERFVEAMAYPEIDLPMYRPLVERSSELFLPNINFIAENSISLLETNQPFIESYMIGLNHEFARELLWREYPTDQRGSYFRQFWEPRTFHDTEGLDPEELKERLRDIPPIHLWRRGSKLGDHDHREAVGDKEEEVVLVIRGELLKKYPNAVIYAQRAAWKDEDGEIVPDGASHLIDPKKERDLRPLTAAEEANPPRTVLKSPLYEAKVEPDIHFFGFDLTVCAAKGGTGKESIPVDERCAAEGVTWDDPGWFFVIKERPGEPRFGLDIPGDPNVEAGKIEVWNDLSWSDITPPVADGEHIRFTPATLTITADQDLESDDDEKKDQQDEDEEIRWSHTMSSAEIAYVLYQVPTLVAVHASEMLPRT